jgi:hypothetical protein
MSSLSDRLHKLADSASGRCHSCAFQHSYDLPTGTRYWCRAYDEEMDAEQRNAISACTRWQPVRVAKRPEPADSNPLLQPHLESDDRLFWRLKCYLDSGDLDLRTLMIIANGPTMSPSDLQWIEGLDDRFDPEDPGTLGEILEELRGLGYQPLADLIGRTLQPGRGGNA